MIQPHVITMPVEKPKGIASIIQGKNIYDFAKRIEMHLVSKKPYLNHTLTLHDLAEDTGIDQRIISQVINSHWNQNFFSFINAYRVREAKVLLDNFNQHKSTMLGISFDAGFNSKTAFYDAFKKHTGMTPTEYRKTKML
jgi:AraC-like DNA-binding protein